MGGNTIAVRYTVVVVLAVAVLCATVALSSDGYSEETDDDTQFEFTYSDGQTAYLKLTDTEIASSTVVTPEGMSHGSSVFSLSLDRMPTSVTLHTTKGEFRVSLTITSSDPGMAGLPMRVYYGDYVEDLTPAGGYSCKIPSSTTEWLNPNQKYAMSLYIDDGTGTYVPYDPASGLKVSMKWESSEKTRFVRFFSDGEAVGSRFYNTGDTLGEFPPIPSKSVPMTGWFDSFGEEVFSDTVYSYEGDMDFHTVNSFDVGKLATTIVVVIIMGICGMLIVERMD